MANRRRAVRKKAPVPRGAELDGVSPSFDVGLIFVHGIGSQKRGQTLSHFGATIRGWLSTWLDDQPVDVLNTISGGPDATTPPHEIWRLPEANDADSIWLVTEAHWHASVNQQSLRTGEFLKWLWTVPPTVGLWHFAGALATNPAFRVASGSQAIRALIRLPLTILVRGWYVFIFGLLAVLGTLLAPVGCVRRAIFATVGDCYAAMPDQQRERMLESIRATADWVAPQCKKSVILGHSQGAFLSRIVAESRPRKFEMLVGVGSGTAALEALTQARDRERWLGWLVWILLTAFAISLSIFLYLEALPFIYGVLSLIDNGCFLLALVWNSLLEPPMNMTMSSVVSARLLLDSGLGYDPVRAQIALLPTVGKALGFAVACEVILLVAIRAIRADELVGDWFTARGIRSEKPLQTRVWLEFQSRHDAVSSGWSLARDGADVRVESVIGSLADHTLFFGRLRSHEPASLNLDGWLSSFVPQLLLFAHSGLQLSNDQMAELDRARDERGRRVDAVVRIRRSLMVLAGGLLLGIYALPLGTEWFVFLTVMVSLLGSYVVIGAIHRVRGRQVLRRCASTHTPSVYRRYVRTLRGDPALVRFRMACMIVLILVNLVGARYSEFASAPPAVASSSFVPWWLIAAAVEGVAAWLFAIGSEFTFAAVFCGSSIGGVIGIILNFEGLFPITFVNGVAVIYALSRLLRALDSAHRT